MPPVYSERVELKMTQAMVKAIDSVRGDASRALWIRRQLEAALNGKRP